MLRTKVTNIINGFLKNIFSYEFLCVLSRCQLKLALVCKIAGSGQQMKGWKTTNSLGQINRNYFNKRVLFIFVMPQYCSNFFCLQSVNQPYRQHQLVS